MSLARKVALLQDEVDSLKKKLVMLEAPDTWSVLEMDGNVSSLEQDPLDLLVHEASPSLSFTLAPCIVRHIERYTGRLRRHTEKALARYAAHYPLFSGIFSECSVPEELTALAIVESAVNPEAVSSAGAAGMWQLMPSTARELGLVVDDNTDERFDVVKSTSAAALYLERLHAELGSWTLSVMAYNCGPEAVRKARIRSGGSKDVWDVISFLPEETGAYLPAFLAVSYLTVYGESREGLMVK